MVLLNQVRCIKGHEEYLQEGKLYTVLGITKSGHYILLEVDPPYPYNCFHESRFEPTDSIIGVEFEEDFTFEEELAVI